tara:strand:- start:1190 stop:1375 length:186 start_codon:yes stop_codon:yes gene_type:complete
VREAQLRRQIRKAWRISKHPNTDTHNPKGNTPWKNKTMETYDRTHKTIIAIALPTIPLHSS